MTANPPDYLIESDYAPADPQLRALWDQMPTQDRQEVILARHGHRECRCELPKGAEALMDAKETGWVFTDPPKEWMRLR